MLHQRYFFHKVIHHSMKYLPHITLAKGLENTGLCLNFCGLGVTLLVLEQLILLEADKGGIQVTSGLA